MGVGKIEVTLYWCEKCPYRWVPRNPLAASHALPKVCPRCSNPNWNRPSDKTIPAAKKASKKRPK
jgi:hypothetical protein